MAYKKYIKRNGKIYGPYVYNSKRVGGKVVSEYIGQAKTKNFNRKKFFSLLIIPILLIAVGFLAFTKINPFTGKATLDLKTNKLNQTYTGNVTLGLLSGELIPANATVSIENGNNTYSFLLSDLISENQTNGTYYSTNASLSGSGEGYGLIGRQIIPTTVFFKIKLVPINNSNATQNNSNTLLPESNNQSPSQNASIPNSTTGNSNETNLALTNSTNSSGNISNQTVTNQTIVLNQTTQTNATQLNETTPINQTSSSQSQNTTSTNNSIASPQPTTQTNTTSTTTSTTNANSSTSTGTTTTSSTTTPSTTSTNQSATTQTQPETTPTTSPTTSQNSSTSPLTGNVIATNEGKSALGIFSFFRRITGRVIDTKNSFIQGDASINKDYTYTIPSGYYPEIVPGSVSTQTDTLPDNYVSTQISGNKLIVKTNYTQYKDGFGSNFIGNETKNYNIELKPKGISLSPGIVKITVDSEGKQIALFNQNVESTLVNVTNMTNEIFNQTNSTNFYDYNLTLQEKAILKLTFGEPLVVKTNASSYRNKIIVEYSLGNNTYFNSYSDNLSQAQLNNSISIDKSIWLKDIANNLLSKKPSSQPLNNFSNFYLIN